MMEVQGQLTAQRRKRANNNAARKPSRGTIADRRLKTVQRAARKTVCFNRTLRREIMTAMASACALAALLALLAALPTLGGAAGSASAHCEQLGCVIIDLLRHVIRVQHEISSSGFSGCASS